MKPNEPSIMGHKWGQEGYYKDVIRACGGVIFAGADAGDIYYNGAAVPVMPLPVVAAAVELVSSSAQDDEAAIGTGAWTCRVHGLDGDYDYVTEDFTMDGAVAVVGTQPFLRILKLEVLTAGTGESNTGAIDCQAVGGGQIWDEIAAGDGVSQKALITVPRNKTLWITNWQFSCNVLAAQDYTIWKRRYGGAWHAWLRRFAIVGGIIGQDLSIAMSMPIPEKTDLKMEAQVLGATTISGCLQGFLTDN